MLIREDKETSLGHNVLTMKIGTLGVFVTQKMSKNDEETNRREESSKTKKNVLENTSKLCPITRTIRTRLAKSIKEKIKINNLFNPIWKGRGILPKEEEATPRGCVAAQYSLDPNK